MQNPYSPFNPYQLDEQEGTTAARRRWLAAYLLGRSQTLLPRLALFYQRIQQRVQAFSRQKRRAFGRQAMRRSAAALTGAALLLALGRTPVTHADGITVDGTDCTLIEAIQSANSDSSIGGCTAGSYDDTLYLENDILLTAPFDLYYGSNTGLPLVTTEITIKGNGHTIARDPNNPVEFRILAVSSDGDLTIHNTTISGGSSTAEGGAVYNLSGMLTISNSTFSSNTSSNGGGGVSNNSGTVTISNSTFSGNSASFGGGVFILGGSTTITNSTFSGNSASVKGGGVLTITDMLTITNSTLSGNSAEYGGGLYNGFFGGVTLNNTTITGNEANTAGGGLYNGYYHYDGPHDSLKFYGQVHLNRSLVAGNEAPDGRELFNDGGLVYGNNFNLFGFNSDAGIANSAQGAYFTPGANDLLPTESLAAIIATTLRSNGAPTKTQTQTHALVENSPAIDAAPTADCANPPTNNEDQRGFPRNIDGLGDGNPANRECDIGAFEGFVTSQLFMTAAGPGTTGNGVAFGKEDILEIGELESGEWGLFFDGSAAGLTAKHDLNAIHVGAADDIYLSFFQNKIKTAGVGNVFGQDVIHYDGSGFSLFFDGSDVGLTTTAEKIDALHILDGSLSPFDGCDHYLLISTLGSGKVPAAGGGQLKFQGEDVLGFCLTNSGTNTAGFWNMVLDGSEVGMPKNSTDSISASADGLTLYLTTQGPFNLDDALGGHSMVFKTDGTFSGPHFSAPANGLNQKVDGLHIEGNLP